VKGSEPAPRGHFEDCPTGHLAAGTVATTIGRGSVEVPIVSLHQHSHGLNTIAAVAEAVKRSQLPLRGYFEHCAPVVVPTRLSGSVKVAVRGLHETA